MSSYTASGPNMALGPWVSTNTKTPDTIYGNCAPRATHLLLPSALALDRALLAFSILLISTTITSFSTSTLLVVVVTRGAVSVVTTIGSLKPVSMRPIYAQQAHSRVWPRGPQSAQGQPQCDAAPRGSSRGIGAKWWGPGWPHPKVCQYGQRRGGGSTAPS